MITEPDVVVTDLLLAGEALLFSVLVWRSGYVDADLRAPFALFFGASAMAAFLGAIVHGFFATGATPAGAAMWRATLVALGIVAFASWTIGARMLLPPAPARILQLAAAVVAIVYSIATVRGSDTFHTAIAHYLPPTLFLLIAFGIAFLRGGELPALAGLAGMVLTLAAAVVQQREIALHPAYFNHNALYHTIQALALLLIYQST